MDTRFVVLLAVIALLQSLFARKRAGRGGEAPEETDAASESGDFAERVGASGGQGAPGRPLDVRDELAGRQGAGASVAQHRARPPSGPASAESGRRKKGFLEGLLEEIAAQAKKDLPLPAPGDGSPSESHTHVGKRQAGGAPVSSAAARDALPSFGVPEPRPGGAVAGEPGGPPARARALPDPARALPDPWALGSALPEPVADPSPRPERPSKQPDEVAPGSPRPSLQAARAESGDEYGLRTRDGLRRIVVAREVLGPPLALRRRERTEDVRA